MTTKQEMRSALRRIKVSVLNIEEAFSEGLGLTEDNCSDIVSEAEEIGLLADRLKGLAEDAERHLFDERQLAKQGGD